MINEIIQKYRKNAGYSQSELGFLLGYSQDTISLWEKGKANPDYNNLRKLCIIFNISADELLEVETQEQRKGISVPKLQKHLP